MSVVPGSNLANALERVRRAEQLGYDSVWLNQLPASRDSLLVLAAYAQATTRIGFGTFVLPIYTRHPTAMAQGALTLDELSGGRFRLGIGVSHRVTVENLWGLRLTQPAEAMREYLTIVRALVSEGSVDVQGRHFSARGGYQPPRRADMPIVISALAPRMLELAGELADGVAFWMCAPDYIRDFCLPHLKAGRQRAGKTFDGFEVIASVPVLFTDDRAAGLDRFRKTNARYFTLPFYRAALDRAYGDRMSDEPADDILDDLAGIGDRVRVAEAFQRYREAGVTLPLAGIDASGEEFDRDLQVVAELVR